MSDNIQPRIFWEGVRNYSQNSMTYTRADFELSQVFSYMDAHQRAEINDLFCFGVADGVREPISILQHIETKGRPLPSNVIANDISEALLNDAKSNITAGGWHTKISNPVIYCRDKIDAIQVNITKNTQLRLGVIGVYSLGYFKKALELYKSNADIVGVAFNVYPVYLVSHEGTLAFEHGQTIAFDINNVNDDIINSIHNNVDTTKQLYAQCVYTTDNQFISHYFNCDSLKQVMSHVFTDFDVQADEEENNGRYIVLKLRCIKATGNGITLLTSLNNVLGNIPTDSHFSSLNVLKGMLD